MASPHALQLTGRADWALMIAVHDVLGGDPKQLLHTTASHESARARWGTFRSQQPAPTRLFTGRTGCLPRYARTTPPL
jgi:hypothetical protein